MTTKKEQMKIKEDVKKFMDDLPGFRTRALAKKTTTESVNSMKDVKASLERFESPTFQVGLSFNEEDKGLIGTMSVSLGTPDEIKPFLLQAAAILAGQHVTPSIGGNCVIFQWTVKPAN